LLLCLIWTSP